MADVNFHRAPAYTLGMRLPLKQTSLRVPGPKYDLSNVTRRGPVKVIGASLASKLSSIKTTRTPGPAAYNTVPCMSVTMPTMPLCSIGTRRDCMKKFTRTPAPNAYALFTTVGNRTPNLPSAPMYTISGRSTEPGRRRGVAWYSSPGPARYSAVALDRVKKQMPRPVMLGSVNRGQTRGHRTPAPNAYFPAQGPASRFASAPQFSISGRAPARANPYYTAADKVPDWE
ncbi:outer dense fiber protein 3-like protein 2 [Melanaphis sacchari]|uniref:outer dense fiber protein 3-like protein 2 n=1 Tax=Melanaphis sacchari TaxID=742174 RepID=UPI000DC13899|nr:outer dense fiber protein 3-like protein 2 [Melanaphis sacchari]